MNIKSLLMLAGIGFCLASATGLLADVLEMQNGDRYSGKVMSVSQNTVVLQSEILGKISIPRGKVATLTFGTNNAPAKMAGNPGLPVMTNRPANNAPAMVLTNTNGNSSPALRQLSGDTNVIGQIRQQMLAGNPQATAKFDELVGGLFSGQLSVNDLRREAQTSAAQVRELKRELGPDADEALDGYLKILDDFIDETAADPGSKPSAP